MANRKFTEVKITLKVLHLAGVNKVTRMTFTGLVRNSHYKKFKTHKYPEIVKIEPTHNEILK